MDSLMTTSAVARLINKSVETVRLYDRKGLLPALRTESGMWLFRRGDVEALAAKLAQRLPAKRGAGTAPAHS